ncbi:mechanosensitive ion channel family protein [Evansella cellulosilytica]|uniref:MscS Mechanosensitive ion channel n=1 Tax=Evansella cellulosilytica (strain ATCC 21833 / DSM 2522 / FERM P-1141 / JCM 9156 / N-4) TaxID=649639 RepID=E6TUQ0_EVAC2|nr:mechanosensitive ion channel family protein [Evansella cellulosilytica]ADU30940.1 MscS Mechanosensitive ion channel [Evansella cellulosilytica DSM 2522]
MTEIEETEEITDPIEMSDFLFDWTEIGIAVAIIILFYVFRKLFTKYIFKLIVRMFKTVKSEVITNVLLAYEQPLRVFFTMIGFFVAFNYLPFPEVFDDPVKAIFMSFIVVLVAWGLFNLSGTTSQLFVKVGQKLNVEEDDILLPFVSKLLRFFISAMAIAIIADLFGFNVNGFVAGLGLGGLAFALAAQDSISNFFGGVVIITEKPFTTGDWIITPSVEGTVEDISFRSTKVRTFAQALVTVPNSTLANEAITNMTQMGKRQITFKLGVTYSTSKEKVERCVERIDAMLRNHDDVDQETIMVRFTDFNESSLDIFLYFFTRTTAWVEHLKVKEDINLKIMNILQEESVSVAFPSRSIYMENQKDNK